MKIDPKLLENNLKEILAKNNRILDAMKAVESSGATSDKTALEMLYEELDRQGILKEMADEATK